MACRANHRVDALLCKSDCVQGSFTRSLACHGLVKEKPSLYSATIAAALVSETWESRNPHSANPSKISFGTFAAHFDPEAHNSRMSVLRPLQTSLRNPENHTTSYPTPPPLLFHAPENNDVTSIKSQTTCRNKAVTDVKARNYRVCRLVAFAAGFFPTRTRSGPLGPCSTGPTGLSLIAGF